VLVSFGFSQIPQGSLLESDTSSVVSGIREECNPQIYVCWPRFLQCLGILRTFSIFG
jgi:hypothetical protein